MCSCVWCALMQTEIPFAIVIIIIMVCYSFAGVLTYNWYLFGEINLLVERIAMHSRGDAE